MSDGPSERQIAWVWNRRCVPAADLEKSRMSPLSPQDSIDRDAVYDSAAEQLHEREMHIWERRSADAIWSQEWVEPPRSPYYDSQYDDD